jgi:hypothetical protein
MKRILVLFLSLTATAQVCSRDRLYSALLDAKVLNPDRELVHLSCTCNLRIDGSEYPVVDVQEVVKSDTSPRGVNRIVVLDAKLKPVKEIEYTSHRPLFCLDNRLYVYGDLTIDGLSPEGNVLTFSRQGRVVKLSHIEAHDYPVPVTRDRKSPPQ